MIDEYQKALMEFYKAEKNSHRLSSELENPNRTKLKQEFLRLYRVKNEKSDTEIIKRFFDPESKFEDQLDSITKLELDKLRPLINFLTKETKLQTDEPVHAIAWLLGFTPYSEWKILDKDNTTPLTVGGTEIPGSDKDDNVTTGAKSVSPTLLPKHYPKINMYIIVTFILFCIGFAVVWKFGIAGKVNQPTPKEKCMYWDGVHYKPIECDKYAINKYTIPLDVRVLNNLKKIRCPDLLTKKDIGKVWYVRIDGQHEFFTDSGRYPLDLQKKLKPLSAYILSSHVSYYRFILHCLFWFTSMIIFIVIVYVWIKKFFVTANSASESYHSSLAESNPDKS